ncbi:MAG TPA: GNAT family N-acetyltransferase [Pedococcus sp.]|nr:GNAT family N-acetyltransferase [Pedococcus sp.]
MQPTSFTYRVAEAGDADLVLAMLMHAANWDPARPALTPEQLAANPQLSHYAKGWPQPGDLGVVVEDAHGEGRGVAWLRYFTATDPSYGFVDERTPELSIGVDPAVRGQGLGTELCTRLLDAAESRDIEQVSLSVEKANSAIRLYQRLGFETVRDDGDAVTMLRRRVAHSVANKA